MECTMTVDREAVPANSSSFKSVFYFSIHVLQIRKLTIRNHLASRPQHITNVYLLLRLYKLLVFRRLYNRIFVFRRHILHSKSLPERRPMSRNREHDYLQLSGWNYGRTMQ